MFDPLSHDGLVDLVQLDFCGEIGWKPSRLKRLASFTSVRYRSSSFDRWHSSVE